MDRAVAILALRVVEVGYPYRSRDSALSSSQVSRASCSAESVLAALYLSGAPRSIQVSPRNWTSVLRWIRAEGADLSTAPRLLRRKGLREEALTLETPGLVSWAERRVAAGVVLTAAAPEYPQAWFRKLGAFAPAAVWKRGDLPDRRCLAIVGSRQIGFRERQFAREVAQEAIRLGYAVVSGAAAGCDRAAALGARGAGNEGRSAPLVEILPCGMALRREDFKGCVLSPFALEEEFTAPNAMRRNALIYSMAEAAVIVHARFCEGGTWHGAVEANRRRLCRLLVREDPDDSASRALMGLGAAPLVKPSNLAIVLASAESQGELALGA